MDKLMHINKVIQAEAEACLQATRFASDLGMGRIIVETDAMNLKHAWENNDEDKSRLGSFTEKLNSYLSIIFYFLK